MKSPKTTLLIFSALMVLFPLLNSCRSTQMASLPCPEPVKNKYHGKQVKKNVNHKYLARNKPYERIKSASTSAKNSRDKISGTVASPASISSRGTSDVIERSFSGAPELIESKNGPFVENDYNLVSKEFNYVSPLSPVQNSDYTGINAFIPADCDTIILKSGKVLLGKVTEIGAYEVRYRRCDNLEGPVIVSRKSDLAEIRYQNGSREYFTDNDQRVNPAPYPPAFSPVADQRKVEGLGLAGFVASLVGLFIAGIPLGIIAIIFGLVSLSKIKKQPGRFKGRGFAIASFIIGLVDVVAMIILLAAAV